MKNGNFTVEILRAPVVGINRLEWKGGNSIPEVAVSLSPPAFLSVTSPAGFKGRVEVSGCIEHYEKDENKWTYRWSEAAEKSRSGQGKVLLKHEDPTKSDIVVSIGMSPASGLVIKYQPLSIKHIAITAGIAFVLAVIFVIWLRS